MDVFVKEWMNGWILMAQKEAACVVLVTLSSGAVTVSFFHPPGPVERTSQKKPVAEDEEIDLCVSL